jgi:hypothetical protein
MASRASFGPCNCATGESSGDSQVELEGPALATYNAMQDELELVRQGEGNFKNLAETVLLLWHQAGIDAIGALRFQLEIHVRNGGAGSLSIESADRDRPLIQAINGALAEIAREGRSVRSQTEPRL